MVTNIFLRPYDAEYASKISDVQRYAIILKNYWRIYPPLSKYVYEIKGDIYRKCYKAIIVKLYAITIPFRAHCTLLFFAFR